MFYVFAVFAGLFLLVGISMIFSSLFKLIFKKGDRATARKELSGGLIGAPLFAIILLALGQWIDPQPLTAGAREASTAALALEEQGRQQEEQARAEAERQADMECRRSIQCWGDRHFVAASIRCTRPVERLASYSMEWTDGLLEPKFSQFRWSPSGDGILVFIGDMARFQNGFGAWQNVIYECTYDPASEQVLDATAQAGRL